eukprot:2070658-Pleurochrysis_carterae.AAC.1
MPPRQLTNASLMPGRFPCASKDAARNCPRPCRERVGPCASARPSRCTRFLRPLQESALANQKYAEVLEALKAYSALV